MHKKIALVCLLVAVSVVLAACGGIAPISAVASKAPAGASAVPSTTPTPSGPPTPTPDMCTAANLPVAIKYTNTFMVEFDSNAAAATTAPSSQLSVLITALQQIQTAAQGHVVPPCLTNLKQYQLQYMDTVVQTLVAYHAKPKVETLSAGILTARQYSKQYATELARLLGTPMPGGSETPIAQATAAQPTAAGPAETATPVTATVLNPGPNALNLHVSPSLTAQTVAVLDANLSTTALGRSANGEFLLVEIPNQPGKTGWVYTSLVQFTSGSAATLPVATP